LKTLDCERIFGFAEVLKKRDKTPGGLQNRRAFSFKSFGRACERNTFSKGVSFASFILQKQRLSRRR